MELVVLFVAAAVKVAVEVAAVKKAEVVQIQGITVVDGFALSVLGAMVVLGVVEILAVLVVKVAKGKDILGMEQI